MNCTIHNWVVGPFQDPLMDTCLVLVGVLAGALTTVGGVGGGIILTLVLAAFLGPGRALAISAPALLLGNVQRIAMYREYIEPKIARIFALSAAPAVVAGGLLVAYLDESLRPWLLLGGALLAGVQAVGLIPERVGRKALVPGLFSVGFLTASTGGGGILAPTLLMSVGLSGRHFVATASLGALAIHVVRIGTYGATKLLGVTELLAGLVLALCIAAGNLLGRKIARRLDDRQTALVTRSAIAAVVLLGLWTAWLQPMLFA